MDKIYDSVHGFIRINELERELIDSPVFQRLHLIHQLGISYLVYPGATHTRFEHSLGTMELATRIFDRIARFPVETTESFDQQYWRQIVRIAALCHDLGHLPYSHVAEKRLLGKLGHEKWTLEILRSDELQEILHKLEKQFPGYQIRSDLIKICLGEEKLKELDPTLQFSKWQRVFSQIISGDFFGADRIDYLLRDAKSTGLSYGLFDYSQLIEMLRVLPSHDKARGLELGIDENGIESCEALLLARHFMYRRLYQYPSAKAYSFHLSRFMGFLYNDPKYVSNLKDYLSMSEAEVQLGLKKAQEDAESLAHLDACCMIVRKKRFKAVALPMDFQEKELAKLRKNLSLSPLFLDWEWEGEKTSLSYGLSVPVLKRNLELTHSSTLSEISIPAGAKNWVYVSPEYQEELFKLI